MQARKKGKYRKNLVNDYCVIDLETTGLSSFDDKIIEIGILRVRNGIIVDKYSQLIDPECFVSSFITKLTGISNDMLMNQPTIHDVKEKVLEFIGQDVLLGHNTTFDLGFLAQQFDIDIVNEYMDTLRLSRKVFPGLPHYRLTDLVEHFDLSQNEHRSLADCVATYELFEKIKIEMNKES